MGRDKSVLLLFIGYVWVTTLAGLAIHPYKSVRGMVQEEKRRILLPVLLTPTMVIIVMLFVGRVGSYFFNVGEVRREILAFMLGSLSVGLFVWQVMMGYLVYRFSRIGEGS